MGGPSASEGAWAQSAALSQDTPTPREQRECEGRHGEERPRKRWPRPGRRSQWAHWTTWADASRLVWHVCFERNVEAHVYPRLLPRGNSDEKRTAGDHPDEVLLTAAAHAPVAGTVVGPLVSLREAELLLAAVAAWEGQLLVVVVCCQQRDLPLPRVRRLLSQLHSVGSPAGVGRVVSRAMCHPRKRKGSAVDRNRRLVVWPWPHVVDSRPRRARDWVSTSWRLGRCHWSSPACG